MTSSSQTDEDRVFQRRAVLFCFCSSCCEYGFEFACPTNEFLCYVHIDLPYIQMPTGESR